MAYPQRTVYRDRAFKGTKEDLEDKLKSSTTLYIGNLSFYTEESQIYSLFSYIGAVKSVIMGLNKVEKTPCGFCFVEYYERCHAENAVRFLNGTMLDGRVIRADIDAGFEDGRQYGRGRSGGQIRDERRTVYDEERGGYPKIIN